MLPKDIFQKHQYIGLDLDETLAESVMEGIKKLHLMNRMRCIQDYEHITAFDFTEISDCDMSSEELTHFWKSQDLEDVHPVQDSIIGVAELFQKNKLLHVITARNEHDHRSDTERWLNLYFPEIHPSHIHFANHFAKQSHLKSTICKSLGITIMIDDGLHNALDVAENGIECVLIDKPWNRKSEANHPLIYRAQDWKEIIDVL